MPRLSIIIPVLGDSNLLDDTLVSVLENRPSNCEILVFHNQPYHDPYELAGEVRFFELDRKAGIVECLNLGLTACRSPVVHVLACGVEVFPGWADAAMRHFRDPQVAAVAAVVLQRDDCRKIASAGLAYRAEGETFRIGRGSDPESLDACEPELCGPDLLAAFYCKSTLQEVGGFSHWATDALVGIDAALAIRQAGFRCALEPECLAKVDVAAVEDAPSFRLGYDTERLFWRWASAHGWVRSLVGHAALAAGQSVLGLWHPKLLPYLAGRASRIGRWSLGLCFPKRKKRTEVAWPSVIVSPHFVSSEEPSDDCESVRAA